MRRALNRLRGWCACRLFWLAVWMTPHAEVRRSLCDHLNAWKPPKP